MIYNHGGTDFTKKHRFSVKLRVLCASVVTKYFVKKKINPQSHDSKRQYMAALL